MSNYHRNLTFTSSEFTHSRGNYLNNLTFAYERSQRRQQPQTGNLLNGFRDLKEDRKRIQSLFSEPNINSQYYTKSVQFPTDSETTLVREPFDLGRKPDPTNYTPKNRNTPRQTNFNSISYIARDLSYSYEGYRRFKQATSEITPSSGTKVIQTQAEAVENSNQALQQKNEKDNNLAQGIEGAISTALAVAALL